MSHVWGRVVLERMLPGGFYEVYLRLCSVHRRRRALLMPSKPERPYSVPWKETKRSRDFSWSMW